MLARGVSRAAARTVHAPIRSHACQIRFVSGSQLGRKLGSSKGLAGLAGAALLFAAGYSYTHSSSSESNTSAAPKSQLEQLSLDIPANAPEPSQGLPWLRSTATAYAVFIPDTKPFIDSAFDDLEAVQQKHGKRVDDIVQTAHRDLKEATKNGLDLENVWEAWEVIEKATNQISDLAAESTNDIQGQHPDIKEKFGEKLDYLKKMAEDFGPEARKELEDAYQKIKNVLSGGLAGDTVDKIRTLIQEKIQTVEKLGDAAWERGLEEAKQYIDMNTKIRTILEENKEKLKHGNLGELWIKVKEAALSGDTDALQKYVRDQEERRRKS